MPVNGGLYVYGNSAIPTQSYQATNYWVDVLLHDRCALRYDATDGRLGDAGRRFDQCVDQLVANDHI